MADVSFREIVIFGTGEAALLAHYYFETDSPYRVAAFTVDGDYMTSDRFEGKPVIPFERVTRHFPPSQYGMHVGITYPRLNKLREAKCHAARRRGYSLVSYVSSRCAYLSQYPCGENCFILENCTVQPYARIGNGVILWSGSYVAHHAVVADHVFVGAHAVVSGHCVIGARSFLGVGALLHHRVTLAEDTLVGAGAVITRDTRPGEVYVPARTLRLDRRSDEIDI